MGQHHRRLFPSNARPPRSPSDPIKGCPGIPSFHCSSPTPPCPISEPEVTRTGALPFAAFTTDAPPLHCLSSPGELRIRTPVLPFPSSAPRLATPATRVAGGRALVRSGMRKWPPVHGGLGRRGPQPRGLSPWIFPSKNNFRKSNFLIFLGKIVEKCLKLQTFITFQPQLQIQ
jgi:hypothetical protein